VVVFHPLGKEHLMKIIDLQLERCGSAADRRLA